MNVHVHAKTPLTEPVRPGVRQQSGSGEGPEQSTRRGPGTGRRSANGDDDQEATVLKVQVAVVEDGKSRTLLKTVRTATKQRRVTEETSSMASSRHPGPVHDNQ